jgi:hypothetical protein
MYKHARRIRLERFTAIGKMLYPRKQQRIREHEQWPTPPEFVPQLRRPAIHECQRRRAQVSESKRDGSENDGGGSEAHN